MASKQIIPPALMDKSPSRETLQVLQNRLLMAEEDTKSLVDQLSKMGFEGNSKSVDSVALSGGELSQSTIPPYMPRMADPQILQQNYEVIVSRVCKMESAIQTLKLNLLRANAERDLSKKERVVSGEKLSVATEAYEKELSKLNRELVQARKECKEVQDERRKAVDDVRRLQDALEVATSSKVNVHISNQLSWFEISFYTFTRCHCQ